MEIRTGSVIFYRVRGYVIIRLLNTPQGEVDEDEIMRTGRSIRKQIVGSIRNLQQKQLFGA